MSSPWQKLKDVTRPTRARLRDKRYIRAINNRYRLRKSTHKSLLNTQQRDFTLIVSLTSYGERIRTAHNTLRSIFAQSELPDRVILCIGDEPQNDARITAELIEMQKYGLEIWRRPDIGPHTKYYYAIKENPEDVILTVDDDILYDSEMIRTLVESYRRYPNAVSAHRVHRLLKSKGELLPYAQWGWEYTQEELPSTEFLVTGVAGALYPPHCMHPDLFDVDALKKFCLYADDVWLKLMQIKNNTPAVWTWDSPLFYVQGTQAEGLFHANLEGGQNDLYIQNLQEHFDIRFADYAGEADD